MFLRGPEGSRPGLSLTTRRMAKTVYVPFDESVQKVIAQADDGHGLEHIHLLSDAGHDAEEIAAPRPTAMIFVRGGYDGISHNPREYSTLRHAPTASTSWPPPPAPGRPTSSPSN